MYHRRGVLQPQHRDEMPNPQPQPTEVEEEVSPVGSSQPIGVEEEEISPFWEKWEPAQDLLREGIKIFSCYKVCLSLCAQSQ